MRIANAGLQLIKISEGYHTKLPNGDCKAYLDKLVKPAYRSPGYNGLWTIGYGCTVGVTKGMVWTEKQATAALMREIAKHETALNAKIKQMGIKLDQNQFDALISASYNLGIASKLITSVLLLLQSGDEAGAARVFPKYNKAGGIVRKGLVTRRAREAALFLKHTPETLTEASRKLTWMQRIRMFIASLGLGTYLTWDTFAQVKTFATDNAGLLLLGAGAAVWLLTKFVTYTTTQDYERGAYTPSGDAEDGEAQ